MSKRYGVRCASGLGHEIPLETVSADAANQISFYTVPTEAIVCPDCGFGSEYGSSDGFEFELADTIPNLCR